MVVNKNIIRGAVREYCSRRFYNFFTYFWKQVEVSEYENNWHIEMVCGTLQTRFEQYSTDNVNEEELRDLIFNLPPGCSKSLMISVFFPAWVWLVKPETKIISYSYSYKVAEELAGKSLRLIASEEYMDIVDFKLTSTAVSNIKNDKLGQRFVTSTGGAITGIHADIIIGDDPNSPASINSEAYRLEARRFVREILPSRKTSIKRSYSITVQQRLHNEDVTGCLVDLGNPKIISIPAVNDEGESFFPARFSIESLMNKRMELGSVSYMAQYMQVTQDEEGGIIKRAWVRELPTENKVMSYYLDSAYGGVKADYNAIIGSYKEGNNLIIQMCEVNKFEFPELLKWISDNIPANSKIYVEGKASGKSVIQTLKQTSTLNVIEIQPKGSKLERKHSISPYFEGGRVIINSRIKNKQMIIEQLIFDNTKNDDIMDVIIMAVDNLLKKNKANYNII